MYNEMYKEKWEQLRWLGYVQAGIWSEKIKSPKDLLKFPWEEEKVNKEIDNSVVEKLISIMNGKV